ncbi:MAG TPA: AMP-binding protein [Nevskiaceae bacterium]|nr:AMP-binding protein [Nevskiaceae bacterium]
MDSKLIRDDDLPLQRLYRWERTRPDRVYLTQPTGGGQTRDFTWRETLRQSRCVAAWLQSLALPAGSRVGILSKNCAHWLMMDFAIWMAGYVSVPLYPTLTVESVRQIIDDAGMAALFIGKLDGWPDMQAGVPRDLPTLACELSPPTDAQRWEEVVAKTPPLAGSPLRPAEDLATIIYTSGTTGAPNGVMHSFGTFALVAKTMQQTYQFHADERLLSYLPLSHVAERASIEAGSIYLGCHVFFAESLDTFQHDLQRARPTLFLSVPRLWVKFQQAVFAKLPARRLDHLLGVPFVAHVIKRKILRRLGLDATRVAATGAAPLPEGVTLWYRRLGLELLEAYGMTENFGLSHSTRVGDFRSGYVGAPWPHVECRLADSGEVLMRAPWVMLGYYHQPEKTAATVDAEGWLRTGDLGEIDAQGRLRITGRVKELFKTSKGKYVAPAPIENRLGTHAAIEAVCVTGAGAPQPFAIAMLSAEAAAKARDPVQRARLEASFADLLASVNAQTDHHERLDFIALVDTPWSVENGLVTPTLKIKRNAVERTYGPQFAAWAAVQRPVVWTF